MEPWVVCIGMLRFCLWSKVFARVHTLFVFPNLASTALTG